MLNNAFFAVAEHQSRIVQHDEVHLKGHSTHTRQSRLPSLSYFHVIATQVHQSFDYRMPTETIATVAGHRAWELVPIDPASAGDGVDSAISRGHTHVQALTDMTARNCRGVSMATKKMLKLMIASSVYGFETEIAQLCGVLASYGYVVLNSHTGTIRPIPGRSNIHACLRAVEDCDVFFGIIRPFYSSGITHKEIRRAIELEKPCWFVAHAYVTFARQIFKQYRFNKNGTKKSKTRQIRFEKTSVMDDLRVIDMYDEVIADGQQIEKRNWAQPFFHFNELLTFVDTVFRDVETVNSICEGAKS